MAAEPPRSPSGGSQPDQAVRADPVAWLIALAAFAAYTTISVFKYLQLDPGSWDLGMFTEYVRQLSLLRAPVVAIKGHGFNLLGDHFQPIVALIAPFFRFLPSPVTLLVAQALLTAVSVVPVCRAAQVRLGTFAGRSVGAAYAVSWGLQRMINFGFHEVAFAVPLLAFSLSALVRGRLRAAVLWACGGGLLMAWGMVWSLLAIHVIIPYFNPAHHYPYWKYGRLFGPGHHFSVPALAQQLARGGMRKLQTTATLLLPVAFLALFSPLALAAVPGLAMRFLSVRSSYWGTEFHYNAPLMPIMFLAAIDALSRLSARLERGLRWGRLHLGPWPGQDVARSGSVVMAVIAAALVLVFPLARLWAPRTYVIDAHVQAEQAAMARVPDGVTVEATETMLAPLAARDETSWTGNRGIRAPGYVVFDATNSGFHLRPASPLRFVERRHPGTRYRQVFEARGVYVFRRVLPAGGRAVPR
jgi:uncharacterized membrane protein